MSSGRGSILTTLGASLAAVVVSVSQVDKSLSTDGLIADPAGEDLWCASAVETIWSTWGDMGE